MSFMAALAVPLWAQTWTSSQIQNGINGYDYELWNQDNKGTVRMEITGDNGTGANAKGGTFNATWSGTCNVLFRSGKKWGTSNTRNHTDIGQITFDFAANWNSPDDVKYLGLYGWAYYKSDKVPTKRENGSNASFSNQIEWYIIQDRGSYNPTSGSDCKGYGEATINGIAYDLKVCDRIGQPMLTGNGNFKQFFSVPKSTSSHRSSGIIDATAHFKAWHNVGMYMDGPLYEAAMKVESYKCSGTTGQGSGSASVTKNLMTIGGTPPPATSSNSGGGGTGSSSSARTQATTCKTPLITYPTSTVPTDPYTACFRYTDNKCYVCKVENEGEFEGNLNTCASGWVWDGTRIDDNLTNGYWYYEVPCPATGTSSSSAAAGTSSSSVAAGTSSSSAATATSSSSRASSSSAATAASSSSRASSSSVAAGASSSSRASSSSVAASSSSEETSIRVLHTIPLKFRVRSLNNGTLNIESNSDAVVYLYNTKGNMVQAFDVPTGSSIVKTVVPTGIYIVKNSKTKEKQRVMVK
nr:xylanase precursor [uncultured bacterium]